MKLTKEQQAVFAYVEQYKDDCFVKIEAVAGSGKTATLTELAKIFTNNVLYLAYNKSIAEEATGKFPRYVDCKTTHSLAYLPVVVNGLNVDPNVPSTGRHIGEFTYKDITNFGKHTFEERVQLLNYFNKFCLSTYTILETFIENEIHSTDLGKLKKKTVFDFIYKYFYMMVDGEIPVTHNFYLKFYHILLDTKAVIPKTWQCIMLDEAGDVNGVTLEIFKLLPAKTKIMVGDRFQNIYSFNETINGFLELKNHGKEFALTKSFRCNEVIADAIEVFGKQVFAKNFKFEGTPQVDKEIKTIGLLTRTNSGIIGYIIDLMSQKKKFSTIRKVSEIFGAVIALLDLQKGKPVTNHSFKFLNEDLVTYNKSDDLQETYKNVLSYIEDKYADYDQNIKTALRIVRVHGSKTIWNAYFYAREQDNKQPLILSTIHSAKGLEFDKVVLGDDINLGKILDKDPEYRTKADMDELNLYYVACSRAKLELHNVRYLGTSQTVLKG
jgi:hypothetical protein